LQVTYYVAASLDGYIAKTDGDVSWLDSLGISMDETDYDAFFGTVDALVMGRKTYDFVQNYGTWPYGDTPTWVCSTRKIDGMEGCNLQKASDPLSVGAAAKLLNVEHLWLVGGGVLASAFLANRLLTHVSISQMPILLGSGIRLFSELSDPIAACNQSVRQYPSGFSQLDFEIEYTK